MLTNSTGGGLNRGGVSTGGGVMCVDSDGVALVNVTDMYQCSAQVFKRAGCHLKRALSRGERTVKRAL